jgi:hypothetical protein
LVVGRNHVSYWKQPRHVQPEPTGQGRPGPVPSHLAWQPTSKLLSIVRSKIRIGAVKVRTRCIEVVERFLRAGPHPFQRHGSITKG